MIPTTQVINMTQTSFLKQARDNIDMNVLDLPESFIDFEEISFFSCGLENSEEILRAFIPFFEQWQAQNLSIQEFARQYASQGISIWTAKDINSSRSGTQILQIFMEGKVKGYLLLHYYPKNTAYLQ